MDRGAWWATVHRITRGKNTNFGDFDSRFKKAKNSIENSRSQCHVSKSWCFPSMRYKMYYRKRIKVRLAERLAGRL